MEHQHFWNVNLNYFDWAMVSIAGLPEGHQRRQWEIPQQGVHLRIDTCGPFLKWGYPKLAGWFISWKLPLKWMMTGGTRMT